VISLRTTSFNIQKLYFLFTECVVRIIEQPEMPCTASRDWY